MHSASLDLAAQGLCLGAIRRTRRGWDEGAIHRAPTRLTGWRWQARATRAGPSVHR